MSVKKKEYLLSVNSFNRPSSVSGSEAIGVLLMELILMEPGSNPLKPEMGVGIKNYRYAKNRTNELIDRIKSQITEYLPEFLANCTVELEEVSSTKLANIRITIDNVSFVYNSETAPVAISLEDIAR